MTSLPALNPEIRAQIVNAYVPAAGPVSNEVIALTNTRSRTPRVNDAYIYKESQYSLSLSLNIYIYTHTHTHNIESIICVYVCMYVCVCVCVGGRAHERTRDFPR